MSAPPTAARGCGLRARLALAALATLPACCAPEFVPSRAEPAREPSTPQEPRIPELPGERRCLSLRVLAELVREAEASGQPLAEEALSLAGIGRLEGFYVDTDHADVVLVGRREAGRPSLRLDDLVLALRIAQGDADPFCSLDPRPEHVLRTQQVLHEKPARSDREALRRLADRLQAAIGPQDVVVGGVPRTSHWAHVMIDADYDMKKISQGKLSVPGVASQIAMTLAERRRQIETGAQGGPAGARMSRFWFHVADGAPTFLETEGMVFVQACAVSVLTEAQRASADGTLSDSGADDDSAAAWARTFSAAYDAVARAAPSCAELENLYRLLAVARAIEHRGAAGRAGLDLSGLRQRCRLREERPMSPSLPGLANADADQLDHGDHRYWFASIACGGVSMELTVADASFHRDARAAVALDDLWRRACARRPNGGLWWAA